jgi:hypothetical protein
MKSVLMIRLNQAMMLGFEPFSILQISINFERIASRGSAKQAFDLGFAEYPLPFVGRWGHPPPRCARRRRAIRYTRCRSYPWCRIGPPVWRKPAAVASFAKLRGILPQDAQKQAKGRSRLRKQQSLHMSSE